MAATGFLEQRPGASPLGLGTVLLLHAGVIGAVLLIKGPIVDHITRAPTTVTLVPAPTPPPPEPRVEPQVEPPPLIRITPPEPLVHTPLPPVQRVEPGPPLPPLISHTGPDGGTGTGSGPVAPPRSDPPPAPPPVRTESSFAPGAPLQPPYPAAEIRRNAEGQVRVRVTIGTNGRVLSISQISATSQAFWQATERWALSRWRFRPATVDGRPVESTKVLTVHFRLDGQ